MQIFLKPQRLVVILWKYKQLLSPHHTVIWHMVKKITAPLINWAAFNSVVVCHFDRQGDKIVCHNPLPIIFI